MRSFGDITAVRLALWEHDEGSPTKLHIPFPVDQWHPAIIDLCWRRFQYCLQIHNSAMSVYQDDIELRGSYDGRAINPLPVRLSWGMREVVNLHTKFGATFDTFTTLIDWCRERATFGSGTRYERLSRRWLRYSRGLRDRVVFSLRTSMWIQWINQSLWEAHELLAHIQDDESQYLQQYGPELFSYIAHPPLLVAVLTSSAMVEEVGAVTVKELDTDVDPDLDDTTLENVLGWLRDQNLTPENIDLNILDDRLREARNDLSHSMTARATTVTLDTFETYAEAVQTAIRLGLSLVNQLVRDVMADLNNLPLIPRADDS